MRKLSTFIMTLFVLAVFQIVSAKPFLKCHEYRSGEEMDHSRVSCYLQDSKGMLWLGTWIGLCRYDGKDFRFFRYGANDHPTEDDIALGSNRVLRIELDSRENIWCLNNDGGLYRFDRKTSSYLAVLPLIKDYQSPRTVKDKVYVMRQNHVAWVTLTDGTLVRFNDTDPADNTIIPVAHGLQNRHVYQVAEDHKGREWALTDQGVFIYGKGLVSSYQYSRFVEQDGHIFLSSNNGQVAEYMEDETFRIIQLPVEIGKINDMRRQLYSEVSISSDKGLLLYNVQTRKCRFFDVSKDGQPIREVARAMFDSRERIWFYAEASGIYCLNPGEEKPVFLPNPNKGHSLKNENGKLYLFLEDMNGTVWVKPRDGELCWFDEYTSSLHSYRECTANGQECNFEEYNVSFVDSQHNLWLSSGTRIYQLIFGKNQFYSKHFQPAAEIRALLSDGWNVLFGDREGNLGRYNFFTQRSQYLMADGHWSDKAVPLMPGGIYCMKRDSKGNVWVGSRGSGLIRMRAKGDSYQIEHYQSNGNPYDLNCNTVYDIYEDECDRVWIATFGGGINMVESQSEGKLRFINVYNELFNYPISTFDVVRCLQGDGHGRILAGTNKGILAFSSHKQNVAEITYNAYQAQSEQANPLPDNMVMHIMCSAEGTFYICTFARGMCRLMGEGLSNLEFEPMTNRDFPAGNVNLSGFIAKSGRVWTISECGLTCFNVQNGKQWYFDSHDNDEAFDLTECTPLEFPNGRVMLGTRDGFMFFQEDGLHKYHYVPKIVFTEREYLSGVNQYRQLLNDIDTLLVVPEERASILHFSTLDLVPSSLKRYAYCLQGIHDEKEQWIRTDLPEVNLTSVVPGKYRLKVRGCNSDGIWSDNTRSIIVIIEPTFWERWLKLIVTVLAILIAAAFVILHLRVKEEQLEQLAKAEISSAKIELLSQPVDKADQEFIQRLMAILESRLSDGNLQVNDLADEMNMSRATFYRRLKQAVDLSPNDFIHQVRMKRSAEMLVNTDTPVAQIAYAVGFNNPKYFSKCFRQDYDLSPMDYRARFKNKNSHEQTM